jgi:ADP-dependent NAD(P)H-hydrate dehydratase
MTPPAPALEQVTQLPRLSPRPLDSHKGTFGQLLVVAGSRGMSGAAVLCGSAALRGGAGLVRLAVPTSILPLVAAGNPCYITVPLPEDDAGRLNRQALAPLLHLLAQHTVLALGPGLGQSSDLESLVACLVQQSPVPAVLDADALNALARDGTPLRAPHAPLILTPHPGEFGRLLGRSTRDVLAHRQELAVSFAAAHQLVLVLKGYRTLVTDGRRLYENTTGNPGMATAGSGDVLTGLIAALLGQGLDPFAAAQLGVWLHGRAGDLARDELGEQALIASDLIAYLPRAFRSL